MEAGRLATLRVVLFTVFGLDQLALMSAHGWRYGADTFNVAHADWLGLLLGPTSAEIHTAIYLFTGFLSLCVAAGLAVRFSLVLMTVLYSYNYFSSMLDGYQHHYLMAWLLLLSLWVPFHRAPGLGAGLVTAPRLKGLGIRLLYAQVSIVYLFTAITKFDRDWLNGWALEQQISSPGVRDFVESFGALVGAGELGSYGIVAHAVMVWQLLVSISFLVPKLRPFACVTGPLFHGMVEVIGLEIRWFSYYMIALYYLLLFPDSWYRATSSWLARPLEPARRLLERLSSGPLGAPVGGPGWTWGTAVIAAVLVWQLPLPGARLASLGVGAAVVAASVGRVLPLGAHGVQVLAAALVLGVPLVSGAAFDCYRYQGNDRVRQQDLDGAIVSYQLAVEIKPGAGSRHHKLAELLVRRGRLREAIEVYEAGLASDPEERRLASGLATARARLAERANTTQDRSSVANEPNATAPETSSTTGSAVENAPERQENASAVAGAR